MAWVDAVLAAVLLEYLVFIGLVGRARGRYGIEAPATSGHPVFERWQRVQGNTLELLVVFVPALMLAARYWNPLYAAGLGALFFVGRALYAVSYVRDPRTRGLGFVLSLLPTAVLVLVALVGALRGAAS